MAETMRKTRKGPPTESIPSAEAAPATHVLVPSVGAFTPNPRPRNMSISGPTQRATPRTRSSAPSGGSTHARNPTGVSEKVPPPHRPSASGPTLLDPLAHGAPHNANREGALRSP